MDTSRIVPIHKDGAVIGVLDIDAPIIGRFTTTDQTELEAIVKVIEQQIS